MPRAKRALKEVDPNVETSPAKSSKANDGRRRSSRVTVKIADNEGSTPVKIGKKRSTGATRSTGSKSANGRKTGKRPMKTPKQEKRDESDDEAEGSSTTMLEDTSNSHDVVKEKEEDLSPEDRIKYGIPPKRSRYDYIIGEPPKWDWRDQHPGQYRGEVDSAYINMMQKMSSVKWHPIEEKPDHKWILMDGALERQVDGVYEARDRDPHRFDMEIDGHAEYGMHEVVENFLADYRAEFTKKASDHNLNEMWVILSGLIHFLQEYKGTNYLLGDIHDPDRVCSLLKLIGAAFLSLLNLLERANRLKSDSEIKDLALIMMMYLIWAQEWDAHDYISSVQKWDARKYRPPIHEWDIYVLKYAEDNNVNLREALPEISALTVEKVKLWAKHENEWPRPGVDMWNFKKACKAHEAYIGSRAGKRTELGGNDMDITTMTKAERKKCNIYGMDPMDRIPKDGIFPDMISHMNEWF